MSIQEAVAESRHIISQLKQCGIDTPQLGFIANEVDIAIEWVVLEDEPAITLDTDEFGNLVCGCPHYEWAQVRGYRLSTLAGQVVCRHVAAEILGEIASHETKELLGI